MKKIYFIIIALFSVLLCTKVMAEVPVTKIAIPRQPQQQTTPKTTSSVGSSKLATSIKTCSPYSESLDSSYLGMNFNFNIKIVGWINNKCTVNFTAKSTGMNGLLQSLYGDAQVMTYEPIAKCAFTQQQLNSVGDSILEEQARKNGGKMLKSPMEIAGSYYAEGYGNQSTDAALMDIIFNQGACSISNGSSNPINMDALEILGF